MSSYAGGGGGSGIMVVTAVGTNCLNTFFLFIFTIGVTRIGCCCCRARSDTGILLRVAEDCRRRRSPRCKGDGVIISGSVFNRVRNEDWDWSNILRFPVSVDVRYIGVNAIRGSVSFKESVCALLTITTGSESSISVCAILATISESGTDTLIGFIIVGADV